MVQLAQVHVVADDVRLVHLGERRWGGAPRICRDAIERVLGWRRDLAASSSRRTALAQQSLAFLAGDAHRVAPTGFAARSAPAPVSTPTGGRPLRTSCSAATNLAISPEVVSSVVARSSPSASVGSSGSASARTSPARKPR